MQTTILAVADADTLHAAAAALGRLVVAGDVIALVGDLGAGKTHFVRGLAEGMGIPVAAVSSPTFTLIQEYRGGRVVLHHVDLYRLEEVRDLEQIGLDELYREATSVVAVEWPDRFPSAAPERLALTLDIISPTERRVSAVAWGERAVDLLESWRKALGH